MTNDPLWKLPDVPTFSLASDDFAPGAPLPQSARGADAGGEDRSPELHWSGAPDGTASFVLTVYDPDAPTGSGFWHWAVKDLPGDATSLPANAGDPDAGLLPAGAVRLSNEFRTDAFLGAAPPAGHGPHRYFFVLSALDVPTLDIPEGATPAVLGFVLRGHLLGRAVLQGTSVTP